MKNFMVKEDSWHYKFNDVLFWETNQNYKPKDFCTYWRHTMYSFGMLFMILLTGGLFIFSIAGLLFAAVTNAFISIFIIGLFTTFIGFIIAFKYMAIPYILSPLWLKLEPVRTKLKDMLSKIFDPLFNKTYMFVDDKWASYRANHPKGEKKTKETSLIVMKYKAYKSKICPMVEYG